MKLYKIAHNLDLAFEALGISHFALRDDFDSTLLLLPLHLGFDHLPICALSNELEGNDQTRYLLLVELVVVLDLCSLRLDEPLFLNYKGVHMRLIKFYLMLWVAHMIREIAHSEVMTEK